MPQKKLGQMVPCAHCGTEFYKKRSSPRAQFCSKNCHIRATGGSMDRVEAFWMKVDKSSGESACWPWKGAVTTHGYGCFMYYQNRVLGAHKVAYMLTSGDVPKGLKVMHTCDTPLCVNPAHLRLGTHQDNMLDKVSKGRAPKVNPRKLSLELAREIRALKGKKSAREVSEMYGVSKCYPFAVWAGRIWREQ